jgi:hypothetical protein
MSIDRTKEIVRVQVAAAELQRRATLMPVENFFPHMIGHMGIVYGPEFAAQVLTIFECVKNDHDEMIDGMMREPKRAAAAFQEGVDNWLRKRG